ncbi:M14 family metallopeptidase [Spirosoma endbachense]|uniref:Peptidase M14 n=1 Tax=Spirosoma endbachense TaxID=2666025 RepID=A0A6P1VZC3_9BACT|nr:M14 family metallopeptidase [Spirosoma endbachense]QHV97127.1 peptidase M14 [Spirosoma endbachense]
MNYYRHRLLLLCVALFSGLAAMAQVPKPADVFGFEPGADYKLANYKMLMDYYQRLDKASNRVQMVTIGKSVLGKPLLLLMVSSEANMKQLDRWRSVSEQLSRAKIDDAQARSLAASGKAIVWVDAGMHASEVASAQMMPELAYRMATEESSEMKKIRDQVVALLMVEMNPDGLDIVADWYNGNLGTPFETTQPPWLYHHYVGHDNNRDWFTNNMPETKAVSEVLYNQWYPQIVYNHHQTSPAWTRIFIPPFANPVNPQIHPAVTAGVNLVGTAMASRFAIKRMPGVVSQLRFSMWWNGGMRTVPYYHNQIGILTETAHATPSPRFYPPDSLPKTVGQGVTAATTGTEIFYADPWKGGQSHFRDAVNYMEEASMATLVLAADKREEFLYNIYRMGRDAIEAAGKEKPYAYIIPTGQWDKGEALNLVNMFRQSGVEVHRATQPFQVNSVSYAAGSYVIYGGQAFSPYVVDLMEKQVHPNQRLYPGGPPIPPYDLAGWTLPMQMGVSVAKIGTAFKAETELIKGLAPVVAGQVAESAGYGYLLSRNQNASVMAVNRLLKDGELVSMMPASAQSTDPKNFLIEKGASTDARIQKLAKELGVSFTAIASKPATVGKPLKLPKIGLYKSWVANMDEGWTRWLMETYGFPVDTLHDADIAKKDLSAYSAIIIPDQEVKRILNGHAANTMPAQYVGGLGLGGTVALQQYVSNGGTLVAFDGASDFAIELFGLPVKNVTDGLSSQQFYIPGSLIRTVIDTKHPLAYGMQPEAAAAFSNSRAFEVIRQVREGEGGREEVKAAPEPKVEVIASYAKKELLMSGWALNEDKYIAGKAAVVRAYQGKGTIVLFGFSPQFRGQPRGTYKLIFNTLYESTLPKNNGEQSAKSE